MSTYGWMIDAVLLVLLSATFVMAMRLDRALRIVRRDRAAFEALIGSLAAATNAVKLGIQKLRDEAERAAEHIERRSTEADRMATDLSFLIERAETAGQRLEAVLRHVAETLPAAPAAAAAVGPAPVAPGNDERNPSPGRSAQRSRRRRGQNAKLKLVG
jgi:hypothetical protein